MTANRNKICWF